MSNWDGPEWDNDFGAYVLTQDDGTWTHYLVGTTDSDRRSEIDANHIHIKCHNDTDEWVVCKVTDEGSSVTHGRRKLIERINDATDLDLDWRLKTFTCAGFTLAQTY